MQVGANYDPLIAKVIAGGPDRETALGTLSSCLSQLQVIRCCHFISTDSATRFRCSTADQHTTIISK